MGGLSRKTCGGCTFRVDCEECDLFYQAFSSLESGLDSNDSELLAILYGLKSFMASLSRKVVRRHAQEA